MDCCSRTADEGAPPCHCSLKPVPPAPAAIGAAHAPAAVLAEATLPAVVVEAPASPSLPAPVTPRARAAPLHVLHSVFRV